MNPVDLAQLASDAPLALRVGIGALGAVVLLAGARLYRFALFGGAFALGAVAAALALVYGAAWLPSLARPEVVGLGAVLTGALLAGGVHLAHRLGLLAVGGIVGLAAGAGVGELLTGQAALFAPLVGALLGAAAMPWFFESLLRFVTPGVGAVCIAYALGQPDRLWLLGGLWALGVAVQVGLLRPRKATEDGD